MVVKQYEALDTFAYTRKDGITIPVVKGNIYDLDLKNVPVAVRPSFLLTEPETPDK